MMQAFKGKWLFQMRWHFEPRDIWVGAYWKSYPSALEIYLCLLPMMPIWLYIQNMRPAVGKDGGK